MLVKVILLIRQNGIIKKEFEKMAACAVEKLFKADRNRGRMGATTYV